MYVVMQEFVFAVSNTRILHTDTNAGQVLIDGMELLQPYEEKVLIDGVEFLLSFWDSSGFITPFTLPLFELCDCGDHTTTLTRTLTIIHRPVYPFFVVA